MLLTLLFPFLFSGNGKIKSMHTIYSISLILTGFSNFGDVLHCQNIDTLLI